MAQRRISLGNVRLTAKGSLDYICVLDRTKLEALKEAALTDDWKAHHRGCCVFLLLGPHPAALRFRPK